MRRALALFACILVVLPTTALAAWRIGSSVEPDTAYDRADASMPALPDTDPNPGARRLYFNVVPLSGINLASTGTLGTSVALDTNSAGSRVAPLGSYEASAYLGAWKDCNRDGYVGHGAAALYAYRAELLPDTSVCPVGSPHNVQGWVRELSWVVPIVATTGTDGVQGSLRPPEVIVDPQVLLWGDFGRPGETPEKHCGSTTFPRGTFSRSGGLVRVADCATQYRLTGALLGVDAAAGTDLAFEDRYHPERDCGHALNRPFGVLKDPNRCEGEPAGAWESGSGDPAFTLWDCSASSVTVRDPTAPEGETGSLSSFFVPTVPNPATGGNLITGGPPTWLTDEQGRYHELPAVAPDVRNVRGSYYDGAHQAITDAEGCRMRMWSAWLFVVRLPLELTNNFVPNTMEKDTSMPDSTTGKRDSDFLFRYGSDVIGRFESQYRWAERYLEGQAGSPLPGEAADPWLAHGPYEDVGSLAVHQARGSGYRSVAIHAMAPSYTGVPVRHDLAPADAVWTTFYARLGSATLATVTGVPEARTYGAESCGAATPGIRGGWDCDPARWWISEQGVSSQPSWARGNVPRVGMGYHMRDVDCLDGSVAEVSLARLLDEGSCAEASP